MKNEIHVNEESIASLEFQDRLKKMIFEYDWPTGFRPPTYTSKIETIERKIIELLCEREALTQEVPELKQVLLEEFHFQIGNIFFDTVQSLCSGPRVGGYRYVLKEFLKNKENDEGAL